MLLCMQLWRKPAYERLLSYLKELEVKPLVWGVDATTPEEIMSYEASESRDRREIIRFLSSVISSNLTWIEGEDQREEIWATASRRLAERCGRTGGWPSRTMVPFDSWTRMLTVTPKLWARSRDNSLSRWRIGTVCSI